MAKKAQCPSCGATVEFASSASVYAVCKYCQSTLLRDGDSLSNLGRMADLMDDPSLIQIGTEGTFKKKRFRVIGRIQLKYEAGLWNEWHVLRDGKSAWLSEANGEYVFSEPLTVADAIPAFETLTPGMPVVFSGLTLVVSDIESAVCVAGEGELPFKAGAGYTAKSVDLRSGTGHFVTFDYSETPPLAFLGWATRFDALALKNLKSSAGIAVPGKTKVKNFQCPHCAAPLKLHSPEITHIVCAHCQSTLGVDNEQIRLLAKADKALSIKPRLPLGARGKWRDVDWEIIGFMRRHAGEGDSRYFWDEYLLFNEKAGFSWLTEYEGHWNYVVVLDRPPLSPTRDFATALTYDRKTYEHFNTDRAEITYVIGEFYWRASVGDTCEVRDYIAPPLMLSCELSPREMSWSQGEYVEPDDVFRAFNMKARPPQREGVYANQPNPHRAAHYRTLIRFVVFMVIGAMIHAGFMMLSQDKVIFEQTLYPLLPGSGSLASSDVSDLAVGVGAPLDAALATPAARKTPQLTTREFTLETAARALFLEHRVEIIDNWVEITSQLIDRDTGAAYPGVQEFSYYSDDEDAVKSPSGSIRFRRVPAGRYYMVLDYEFGRGEPGSNNPVVDRVRLESRAVSSLNYGLLLLFLALFPIASYYRVKDFESKRWAESSRFDDEDDED